MQAAQNITKSCGKREAGPATFVIRKTNPLTAKKSHNTRHLEVNQAEGPA